MRRFLAANRVENIHNAIDEMARAMNQNPLSSGQALQVINHVLMDSAIGESPGKEGLLALESKLITEEELRDLLMAHCATKIARANKLKEPSVNDYCDVELSNSFEKALYGQLLDRKPFKNKRLS